MPSKRLNYIAIRFMPHTAAERRIAMTYEILFAGFGGQGILFSGKVAAYAGLMGDMEVSWLPSYGPEMRGGTANCHVIISDSPVGSPIVNNPTDLVAMNLPSFTKFEKTVLTGGNIIADSSLISIKPDRDDINFYPIPATQMASDMEIPKLANMIIFGKLIAVSKFATMETVRKAVEKSVPPSKKELIEVNMKAIEAGYNYIG
ncbi:MAG: 2-oxoglutarate ferredoxin oxidoreductase subunit gamma [Firmicutes bacterium ADurb.Bin193]|nr:MAG: 2-oxoglutarate ferredoxin oxidoreductase subunit gamma [Firmicutes bacterium ADurb.Bin193]